MRLWVTFSLWTLARGASLYELALSSVKCSCERKAELDVSQTKVHVYNYQSGSVGSWYWLRDAAVNITSRDDWEPRQCVAVYVTGYTNHMDGAPAEMARCSISRTQCHSSIRPLLLIIDHSLYTAPNTIADRIQMVAFYQKSVTYAKSIGYLLGTFLELLTQQIDRNNVFVIGHSLGAHIAGHAAEYVKSTGGSRLSTLYGIDPAAPCYEECPQQHVRSGLADSVITFHCDSDEQGTSLNVADYDLYAGNGEAQAVCAPRGHDLFYAQYSSSCSHNACVSIALSPSFLDSGWTGVKCDSYGSYTSGSCSGHEVTSDIGFMRVPVTSAGVYYFTSPTDLHCYVR